MERLATFRERGRDSMGNMRTSLLLTTLLLAGCGEEPKLDKHQNHLEDIKQSFFDGGNTGKGLLGGGRHEVLEFKTENGTYCVAMSTGIDCDFSKRK